MSALFIIDEHPIPLSEDRAATFQESHPQFDTVDRILHPDELHERYKEVLARNHEWCMFRSLLYGHSGYVFWWNHQLGYGVRFYDDKGSFESLVGVLSEAISLD